MPRLQKRDLLRRFELAIQDTGERLIYRSRLGVHPASYTILHQDGETSRVLTYIWNMTHGGGTARPAHEYRIQITGVSQFNNQTNEKTLILGWSEDFETFAGFDYRRHADVLGSSPSMQISRDALRAAQIGGFAPNRKANGELAVAFRPDFASAYVQHLTALHDSGLRPSEAAMLERISSNPSAVKDADIESVVATIRRKEIVQTLRATRDAQFRRRVLNAYGHRCAVCGVQLRLLDAAHILPVDQPSSTDHTENGVALCALHHRAYDRALIAFDTSHSILVNTRQVAELNSLSLDSGLTQFKAALKPKLLLPADTRDYPRADFIIAANKARGWKSH